MNWSILATTPVYSNKGKRCHLGLTEKLYLIGTKNHLYSRKTDKLNRVPKIKIGEQTITDTTEIAERFNLYFSNIGNDLVTEIPPADVQPECYLKPSTQVCY